MHKLVHSAAVARRLAASCFALAAFSAPVVALAASHGHGHSHAKVTVAMRNCDDGGYSNCNW
jgi:hypothetical protein